MRVRIGLAQEAFSGVGDQDAAIRVTANIITQAGTVVASGDVVAVRHGATVILVVNAALNADTSLTDSVVNRAYEQVAARW